MTQDLTDDLTAVPTRQLLARYAAILDELLRRQVIRTRNAPLGDYAEYLAARAYGGKLASNSVKSYDLTTPDGLRYQVKARLVGPSISRSGVFSSIRSWDFDSMLFLALDSATYDVVWAREVPVADLNGVGRFSAHTNSHLVTVSLAKTLGTDVTARFAPV